jgi:branched-chain amino acid transport system substrate-binding protein
MALSNGQQAIQDTAIGRTKWSEEKKMVLLKDIQRFTATCVNPPLNVKSEDWLKSGFAGAKCDSQVANDKKPKK